jgi:hypothetical protein
MWFGMRKKVFLGEEREVGTIEDPVQAERGPPGTQTDPPSEKWKPKAK